MPPSTVQAALQSAIALHQAGRLAEAEAGYRQILARHPGHPDALHLLGLLAHHQGRNEAAVDLMNQALLAAPEHAPCHGNLGLALQALGRLDEAVASYRRALALDRQFAEAHLNLGNALELQGKPADAIASYRRALQVRPQYVEAHYNLGRVYEAQGQLDDAVRNYQRAVSLRPAYAAAHFNLANMLQAQGLTDEAIASYQQVLALQPEHAEACNNLGAQFAAAGAPERARASYERALALRPGFAEAHNNLGNALQSEGLLDEAITSYRRSLECRPGYVDAQINLGNALQAAGRLDEAIAAYHQALALQPGSPGAEWNLAFALLLRGDYAAGWPLYESRWRLPGKHAAPRGFPQPRWLGDAPVAGQTLLLYHEQGLGDTLQMLRYVSLLAARGARVLVEVPPSLARIAATVPGEPVVAIPGTSLPPFDLYCPMMSLPLAFGTTLATAPATIPYLFAPGPAAADWQERLGAHGRPRIGLAWAGSADHANDRHRSLRLDQLLPLLEAPAEFISLQKDYRDGDLALMTHSGRLRDCSPDLGDFADTAGLLAQLDLVITVDTSVAHLAGALGRDVWLLLPFGPDYRWLLERADSPWYPTMRLFRQPAFGDWDAVVRAVAAALAGNLAAASAGQSP
ncbi:MAG: tetratricopeptide repeat protein [Gammaproteobacteria bacterium]